MRTLFATPGLRKVLVLLPMLFAGPITFLIAAQWNVAIGGMAFSDNSLFRFTFNAKAGGYGMLVAGGVIALLTSLGQWR